MTKKYDELVPPYKTVIIEDNDIPEFYSDTRIEMFQESDILKGFQYIPGKVHADVV